MNGKSSWWQRQREKRIDGIRDLLVDSRGRPLSTSSDDVKSQQNEIAQAVRAWFDRGFEPVSLLQTLVGGVCFIADNLKIPREDIVEMVRETQLKREREFSIDLNP